MLEREIAELKERLANGRASVAGDAGEGWAEPIYDDALRLIDLVVAERAARREEIEWAVRETAHRWRPSAMDLREIVDQAMRVKPRRA